MNLEEGVAISEIMKELFAILHDCSVDLRTNINQNNKTVKSLTALKNTNQNQFLIERKLKKLGDECSEVLNKLKDFNINYDELWEKVNHAYSSIFIDLHDNDDKVADIVVESIQELNELNEIYPAFNNNLKALSEIYAHLSINDLGVPFLKEKSKLLKDELENTLNLNMKIEKDIEQFSAY